MYFTLFWSICIQNVQKESFLALLVFDQSSLCDTPPSVVRPAVRPSGRRSVNNFLFPYLLCNNISQRPNYGLNLLVPWSSCACAILVQPGPHGAPQGGSDQKFGFSWHVSQGPNYGLILLHTWSRYVCVSLVQSRCPGAPQGGKIPKISPSCSFFSSQGICTRHLIMVLSC